MPHRSFQFRAPCGASGFLRKQHPLGNVITEWFSTCAARWYLCNSSSCGAEREGVGKPQRVQVAWQMPDWQRRGTAGHASWNIPATTVMLKPEVRQFWWVTLKRNKCQLWSKSHLAWQMRQGIAVCDSLCNHCYTGVRSRITLMSQMEKKHLDINNAHKASHRGFKKRGKCSTGWDRRSPATPFAQGSMYLTNTVHLADAFFVGY